ncbi:hypothetical protein X771_08540 [Mesorhizobium sp. LSJC277A00]|nr:hypothetical protein X771_08540 [Mesorhizobium sp. LSJC277A00]
MLEYFASMLFIARTICFGPIAYKRLVYVIAHDQSPVNDCVAYAT